MQFTGKLAPHQEEALQMIEDRNIENPMLPYGTSTGKTAIGLTYYIRKFYKPDSKLLIVTLVGQIKQKSYQKTIEILEEYYDIKIDYDIISYGVLYKNIKAYDFVIFDECHKIKNSTSRMGKSAYALVKLSPHYVLMSGNPFENVEDMLNYFKMQGLIKNKTQFITNYAILNRYYKIESLTEEGDRKVEEYWNTFALPYKSKHECFDFPKFITIPVTFNPSKEYKELIKNRVLDGEIYDTQAKLRIGERIYCNKKDKLIFLKELLEGTKENIIVFYNFYDELDAIKEIVPSDKIIFEANGQTKNYPEVGTEEFKNIKNSVTLVNFKAGSASLELQYAHIMVMYSPPETWLEYEQSQGRIERVGAVEEMTCYEFETKNSIEQKTYESVRNKKDFIYSLYYSTMEENKK